MKHLFINKVALHFHPVALKFFVLFCCNPVFKLLVIMQKPWQLSEQQLWLYAGGGEEGRCLGLTG